MIRRTLAYPAILTGIILFGIALRLIGLNKGIWLDEYYAIEIATTDQFIPLLQAHDYPPTYFFLLRLWSSISSSEPFLRLFSALCGVLTLQILAVWLRSLSRVASLLTVFLAATAPILLRYSLEIQAYPLLILAVVVAFYAVYEISGDRPNPSWYVVLAIALSVAVTTHLIGIMIIASVCAYALPMLISKRLWLRLRSFALALLPAIISFGLVYLLFATGEKSGWWMPALSRDLLKSQFSYVLGIDALFAPISWLADYHATLPQLYDWLVKICLSVGVAGIVLFGNWRQNWPLLAAALIYWLQIALYSVLFLPILWYRTLLPGMIPLLAFLGCQVGTIRIRGLRLFTTAILLLLGLLAAMGWTLTEARTSNEAWHEVAAYLDTNYQPSDLIVFYPPYTKGPTAYYLASVPDENMFKLKLDTDTSVFDEILTDHRQGGNGAAFTLFFVVRNDASLSNNNATYQDLLSYLALNTAQIAESQSFHGGVVVSQYEVNR